MAPGDDVLLRMDKQVDWHRRSTYGLAYVSCILAFILMALHIPIHPFILAFLGLILVLLGVNVGGRLVAMGRESLTVTRDEVVVVRGRERRYALGPSTRVHLGVGKRGLTERIGPLKEISFENKLEGVASVSVANGWTGEQVEQVFRAVAPLVETKEIGTTIRFRRYMTDLH
jgi:hypothetical protein